MILLEKVLLYILVVVFPKYEKDNITARHNEPGSILAELRNVTDMADISV